MKIFWTSKRLEAVSRSSLTLFQGFVIAAVIGGVLGKIPSIPLKMLFIMFTIGFLAGGLVLADWPLRKEVG